MLDRPTTDTITRAGHMTEAEYDRERAKIAKTKAEAGVRWEQELARLFARSGWTQKELAKKEGLGETHISYLLRFGQFLDFCTTVGKSELVSSDSLSALTVSRFRGYWSRITEGRRDYLGIHNRDHFRAIAGMIANDPDAMRAKWQRKPPIPKAIGQTIAKTCPKGKWVSPDTIAAKADCTVENVHSVMDSMDRKPGSYGLKAERKKVGKETHYRIFKQDKMVSLDEMTEKLTPIIKGLEVEGKKHVAQRVPAEIARLVFQLKRLLDEWAE
jgi:transcriptional regulator with XRE-family HTH domain